MYDPERYENHKSVARKDADDFVPKLIAGMTWKSNEKILDYGCGAGSVCKTHLVPKALLYNSTIDAVDISQDMLGYAKSKNYHPIINYQQANIVGSNFPFPEAHFDKIFSIYVLHFIKDYPSALKNFYNLLKPGGELGFTVVVKGSIFYILQNIGRKPKWQQYMEGHEAYLPEWFVNGENGETCFKNAMTKINFEILEIRTEKRSHNEDCPDTVIEMIMSLNPYLKKIPEELHAELRGDYRKLYMEYYNLPTNAKSLVTNHEALFCLVRKPITS